MKKIQKVKQDVGGGVDLEAQFENKPKWDRIKKLMKQNWQLYLLLVLPVAFMIVFHYVPMYGAQIAFKNYNVRDGIWGSPWVGAKHFIRFFNSPQFGRLIKNTLTLSVYGLVIGAPFPILLAIMLKYIPFKRFGKVVQTITYAPHFISAVVMVSIVIEVLSPRGGMIHNLLALVGINYQANLMGSPKAFSSIYVWSGVWQNMGFAAIIYTAILSGVDTEQHEAAMVDGASLVQRIRYIDIPSVIPQFTLMLILSLGNILNIGFEKALLMQNPMNASSSEVLDTFVYKMGIAASLPDVSYTTAIGLFKSVIALILIITVNKVARKYGGTSLW